MRGDASWWQFVRRSKNPELPVVLLEDLGAEVGLFIALSAITASLVTDDPIYDGIGTLLIGLLLTVIAIILAVEMKSLLMGETADPKVQDKIRAGVEQEPEVDRLIHLRTQHIGPDELLIGAKVAFVDGLSVSALAAAVNRVEANVRHAVPEARIMYIEPDVVGTNLPPTPSPPPSQEATATTVTQPQRRPRCAAARRSSRDASDVAARRRSVHGGLRGRGTPSEPRERRLGGRGAAHRSKSHGGDSVW